MKNAYAIMSVSRQLGKVCEQIESLASGIQDTEQGNTDLSATYEGLLLDEVEHAQVLTLELTKLLSLDEDEVNTDEGGSVFAEGDLDAQKGDEVIVEGEPGADPE